MSRHVLVLGAVFLVTSGCAGGSVVDSLDGGADGAADDGDVTPDGDASEDGGDADGDDVAQDGDIDEGEPLCSAGWQASSPRGGGALLELGVEWSETVSACENRSRSIVLAAGMTTTLELGGLPAGTLVRVRQGAGAELVSAESTPGGVATLDVVAAYSGEVRVEIFPAGEGESFELRGQWTCLEGCELEATRHPILLVHGMGNEYYFSALEYFYGIEEALGELGYEVRAPVLPYLAHSAERAEVLAEAVDQAMEETGAEKVHLIGHSQGGLDIRVLISGLGYGDRVASATTISSPHAGIRVAMPAWFSPMDVSEEAMVEEFAAEYPDDSTVPMFSWAGSTCLVTDLGCQSDLDGEIVANQLSTTYWSVYLAHSDDEFDGANDGAVPVASARWGEFLGVIPADHFDEIGHIPGQRFGSFDHTAFFIAEARRLAALESPF